MVLPFPIVSLAGLPGCRWYHLCKIAPGDWPAAIAVGEGEFLSAPLADLPRLVRRAHARMLPVARQRLQLQGRPSVCGVGRRGSVLAAIVGYER